MTSLIKQFFKNDIKYQEVLIVPSLNMEVPVAENTNDAVYQFGAGMLVKRKIDSKRTKKIIPVFKEILKLQIIQIAIIIMTKCNNVIQV